MASLLQTDTFDELTPKLIQDILNTIFFARPLPTTPLNGFSIVQAQMSPNVSHMMSNYVLVNWLSNEIMSQYNQHRKIYQLAEVNRHASYPALLNNLDEDFIQNNEYLEAWSILYYRYVRVDLRLSIIDFQNVAGQSDRNLRRRQKVGYTLLCHHLLALERAAVERNDLDEEADLIMILPDLLPQPRFEDR